MSDADERSEVETGAGAELVTRSDRPEAPAAPAPPGRAIGRYVVLEQIGRGGMGRVLRAYDPKLEREVALKQLRLDVLDAESQARLTREARAMARLSHPHVVSVYDVQDSASGVVLVMELVTGPTLRAWLRGAERPWLEIVARFIEAGRGLSAAHARDLLHRDFKPSNVLITEAGLVKVTDFGLAKLASGDDSSGSPSSGAGRDSLDGLLTQTNTVLGTPRYMAPEQHDGRPLSPAVDQYAFCVALWEALTGEPPFSGRWDQLGDLKREGPPPWPTSITLPPRLVDALRRGLAVTPANRWPSMDALLAALAYDPSRRRRAARLTVGALAMLGLGGAAAYGWGERRSARCTGAAAELDPVWNDTRRASGREAFAQTGLRYAPSTWAGIEPRLDAYAADWIAMHTESCEATAVRAEQSERVMDLRMSCLDRARQELDAAIEVLLDADDTVVGRAHDVIAGLDFLGRCADTEWLAAEVEPPPPDELEAVQRARQALARAKSEREAGRYALARRAIERSRRQAEGLRYPLVRIEAALEHGRVLDVAGDFEAAEATTRSALELAAQHRQWSWVRESALTLMFIVGVHQAQPDQIQGYRVIATGLCRGDPRAESHLHANLGSILNRQGDYAAAEAEHRLALEQRRALFGDDDLQVAASRNGLANALLSQGRYEEAEAEHRLVLKTRRRILGAEHPLVAGSRANIALSLHQQGQHELAEREYRDVLRLREATLGVHPDVADAHNNLAAVLADRGRLDEAEAEFRRGLELTRRLVGDAHADVGALQANIAMLLSAKGEPARAEAMLRQAESTLERALSPEHPQVVRVRHHLVRNLLEQGRATEALALAERVWAQQQRDDLPAEHRASAAFFLAMALWDGGGDRDRARTLAHDALSLLERVDDQPLDDERATVERWLEAHP